jgi:hypothetical protein
MHRNRSMRLYSYEQSENFNGILMASSNKIPAYYWEYAKLHAVYLINISPSSGRNVIP